MFACAVVNVIPTALAGVTSLQQLRGQSLEGLNGQDRRVQDYLGRPLLINVWASWCGPCREEMGSLERLAWTPTGQQMAIIGISTDDRKQDAQRFLQFSNATLSHFIDKELKMEKALDASRIPLTVLFDGKGALVGKFYGARDWASADSIRLIQKSLK